MTISSTKYIAPLLKHFENITEEVNAASLSAMAPSLNETDLTVLENEITFAVNGFFSESLGP